MIGYLKIALFVLSLIHVVWPLSMTATGSVYKGLVKGSETKRSNAIAEENINHLTTFVVLGGTGVGKSTIANCIINQRGEMDALSSPFLTSEDTQTFTQMIQVERNEQVAVIDTPSLDIIKSNRPAFINNLVRQLNANYNQTLFILFVINKQNPMLNEQTQTVKLIRHELTHRKIKSSFTLIVNKCERGWLLKPRQRENKYLQPVLETFGNTSYELDLKWDHSSDLVADRTENIRFRQQSVQAFVDFLEKAINNSSESITIKKTRTKAWKMFIVAAGAVLSMMKEVACGFRNGLCDIDDSHYY